MALNLLCMRFQAPLQAWGVESKLSYKDTQNFPTFSAVIGLLASCGGIDRSDEAGIRPLTTLTMYTIAQLKNLTGSLEEWENSDKGIVGLRSTAQRRTDYHTIRDVLKCDGHGIKEVELSWRVYLEDADFLVFLEGENDILKKAWEWLTFPHWSVFLGRKCCIPSTPIIGKLEDCLLDGCFFDYFAESIDERPRQRLIAEVPADQLEQTCYSGFPEVKADLPMSFNKRTFGKRTVRRIPVTIIEERKEKIHALVKPLQTTKRTQQGPSSFS